VAQTRKRRRRKHRGTKGGRVDTRARGRPRSRQEARARTKSQLAQKRDLPPTLTTAATRGLFGAGIFLILLVVLFGRPFGPSLILSVFMLLIYIPMGYFIERFMYNRRQASKQRERQRR
jgi:hypothetical protein